MALRRSDARVKLVHVDSELEARPRLLCGEGPSYRMGDRVAVELTPGGVWRRGHVDHRAPSGPGGVIMVTLDR